MLIKNKSQFSKLPQIYKIRKLFVIACLIVFSRLFCEESDELISYHPYYCPSCSKNDMKENLIQSSQIMPGYNAPGRYDLPFFISGAYLFFQPMEKGTVFALSNTDINFERQRTFDVNVRFKSGFKISLGYSTQFDDWSVMFNYMRYHINKTKNIHQDAICSWASSPNVGVVSHIKARWQLALDLFHLHLSRPFYCGTHAIISPSFGLKGGIIKQKYNTNSIRDTDSLDFYSIDKIRSHLAGLFAELNLRYVLGGGFSLFTQGESSLFYQHFKVRNIQNYWENPHVLHDNSINQVSYINPNVNISAGVQWGNYFFNKNTHLEFLFGYEAQVYWNQNLMAELKEYRRSNANSYTQEAGGLFLHGIIANLRIEF